MRKTGNKKSRNYGNAANQVLFPMGNDSANVMVIRGFAIEVQK
jgi:hypothetical protein